MINNDNKHADEEQLRHQVSKAGVKKEYVERVAQALEAIGETEPKKELIHACVDAVEAHKKLDSVMKSFGELLRDLGKSDASVKEKLAIFKLTEQKFGNPMSDDKLRQLFGMPVYEVAAAPEKEADKTLGGGFGQAGQTGQEGG